MTMVLTAQELEARRYFPLGTGSKWVYQVGSNNGEEKFTMEVVVEGTREGNGKVYFLFTQQDGRGRMRSFLERTAAGIFCAKTGLKKEYLPEVFIYHQPPVPWFVYPQAGWGKTFRWSGKIKLAFLDKDIQLKVKIFPPELVKVPAGEFMATKLEFLEKRNGKEKIEYVWYASDVGQVKYQGSEYLKELISYQILPE